MGDSSMHDSVNSIAVIGMTGRFPQSKNLDEFWQNLRNGVELITFLSDQELEAEGVAPSVYNNPNYVKSAGGVLDDIEMFDASFFDYTPREADSMDPQHRVFLECAWEVLENAGYDPEKYPGAIGVYASLSMNSYLMHNLYSNREFMESLGGFNIMVGNDKDFLTTRASYKFNLTGPSMVVQTACSASLVALCQAVQSLLNYQCDMALAGGVSIGVPKKIGYIYQQGGIASPDGHCRTFDAKAAGTVGGNGVGIVVLKRLADALADGDHIHAIVKGAAMNNDGSLKVGYTAPSVDGQAEVITMAQALAGITADTIGYIEAHGTGTELGDPIEIAALTKAFRATTDKKGFCGIGSVKTNMGHLDAAAGISGFIKAVLTLKNKEIAPSLNFEKPNPKIDFANSPFYVNAKLSKWKNGPHPRRVGVSSFGIGGTNAHVVLEEAPEIEASDDFQSAHLLVLSAKTSTALETMTANLAEYFDRHPDLNLADVAYTLQVGRKAFKHRRMVVCQDIDDAKEVLKSGDRKRMFKAIQEPGNKAVTFMFPGQGAQHINMGKELYDSKPKFHEVVDDCCELLKTHLDVDLRDILYPKAADVEAAAEKLKQTAITQPALFVIEYALAQLWMSWGIRPQAMIGHSIGEYVAACLAGVFSLADALTLVAMRGRLMQSMATGSMVAVSRPASEVETMLNGKLSLAAVNAPALCVISGPTGEVDKLEKRLADKGIDARRLHTSHAFHSEMMDPILEPFTEQVAKFKPSAPKTPFISNVTGTWITTEQATDPGYWAQHLRQAVKFAAGAEELLNEPSRILLEVGPGRTLNVFSGMCQLELRKQKKQQPFNQLIESSMRHPDDKQSDLMFLLNTLGRLWLSGADIDWFKFYKNEKRRRIPLPTYPFERERYWVEPQLDGAPIAVGGPVVLRKKSDIADWFYVPVWRQSVVTPLLEADQMNEKSCWLLFADSNGFWEKVKARLEQNKRNVVLVKEGDEFNRGDGRTYTVNPCSSDDYDALIKDLLIQDLTPNKILHLWGLTPLNNSENALERSQDLGFYSLLCLAKAIGNQNITESVNLVVITNGLQSVFGEGVLSPEKALTLGPGRVLPKEYPNVTCRNVDIVFSDLNYEIEKAIDQVLAEASVPSTDQVIAYRNNFRWVQTWQPVRLAKKEDAPKRLRQGGVYLITGGMGGIGLALAEYLAETVQAKLILTGRSEMPAESQWETWLSEHDEKDRTSEKIRKVKKLEELGGEVMLVRADAANFEQMQEGINQARERFGQINGVIHAAGVAGGGSMQLKTHETAAGVLNPKVRGMQIVTEVLREEKLDFMVLCSSITSIMGDFGQSDYCAANAYLDAFANQNNAKEKPFTVAINWDAWGDVGMAVNTEIPKDLLEQRMASLQEGIMSEDGIDAFCRVLNSDLSQVVVSTRDWLHRVEMSQAAKSSDNQDDKGGYKPAVTRLVKSSHSRPQLESEFVAPGNEIEQTLAEIWQEMFGIDEIGIHDNFFELGGHSLIATGLISRLRDTYHVELTLQGFFEKPTIAELSEIVLEKLVAQEDSETLSQLLEEIEAESEDQA